MEFLSIDFLFAKLVYHACLRIQEKGRALDHEADFQMSRSRYFYSRFACSSRTIQTQNSTSDSTST